MFKTKNSLRSFLKKIVKTNKINVELTLEPLETRVLLTVVEMDLISIANNGTQGNDHSPSTSDDSYIALSGTGRFVAFSSDASNLVPGDTNGRADIFVYDRITETIERVSFDVDGSQLTTNNISPSISDDGRFVVYDSSPGMRYYDRTNDTSHLITIPTLNPLDTETPVNGNFPRISGNGEFIVFATNSNQILGETLGGDPIDNNNSNDIYVYNRVAESFELISHNTSGDVANDESEKPSISDDGRFVAFSSDATDLVAGDTNAVGDVFRYDRNSNTMQRASVTDGGNQANGFSLDANISGDGMAVVFSSGATNLVPGVTPLGAGIYLRDYLSNETEAIDLVSLGGSDFTAGGRWPNVNVDGNLVVFSAAPSLLGPAPASPAQFDVFMYNRTTGDMDVISQAIDGTRVVNNEFSILASVSDSGDFVAFSSFATNLLSDNTAPNPAAVPQDTNGFVDVYLANTRELTFTPGVTVITHGFLADPNEGDSLLPLAEAIRNETNGILLNYTIDEEGGMGTFDQHNNDPTKEIIVLFDWGSESNEIDDGWGEAAGDAFFHILVQEGLVDPTAGSANRPFHFIGHSFGTAVTSEIVERFASWAIPVDHVTYLDPHDFNQASIPFVDDSQRLFDIGLPDFAMLGGDETQAYGATVWNNVAFADAYYETRGEGSLINALVPLGRPIPGAYNRFLDGADELPDISLNPYDLPESSGASGDHSFVWNTFYLGTVIGGQPTPGRRPEPTTPNFVFTDSGYVFSRVLDGQSKRPPEVFYGADQDHQNSHETLVDQPTGVPNLAGLASAGLTESFITNARWAPRWSPFEIVNGDFESDGKRVPFFDIVPGWSHHGGGGDADNIVDPINPDNQVLKLQDSGNLLDTGETIRTHNTLYIPDHTPDLFLLYDYRAYDINTFNLFPDDLEVRFNVNSGGTVTTTTIDTVTADTESLNFTTRAIAIPAALRGQTATLTFELVKGGIAFDAEVHIDNVRFSPTATSTIRGTKYEDLNGNGQRDAGEPGLPNWTFALEDDTGFVFETTVSDVNGDYEFTDIAPGIYTISEFSKTGWTQTTANPPLFDLTNINTINDVDFGNFQTMIISGTKYEDLNGNGMFDVGEPGMAGWTMELDLNNDGTVDATTVTDSSGNYIFSNVGPGDPTGTREFIVSEVQQPGYTTTTGIAGPFPISSDAIYSNLDIGNFKYMTISGTKYHDINGDGMRNPGEPGLLGWTITLDLNNDGTTDWLDVTDSNGYYEFTNVGTGLLGGTPELRIRETLKDGWTQTDGDPSPIPYSSGLIIQDFDFGNFENMDISGTKYEDINGNGSRDPGEPGLANWTFKLDLNNDGTMDMTTTTNGEGNYFFTDVGPGDPGKDRVFMIYEELKEGWTQTQWLATPEPIVSGGNLGSYEFGNFENMLIRGSKYEDINGNGIRNPGEPGLPNWTIQLDLNNDGIKDFETITDENGEYAFENIGPRLNFTPGDFTIKEVSQPGWVQTYPESVFYTHTIQSGGAFFDNDFGNTNLGKISGVKFADLNNNGVFDPDEPGLAGWRITLDKDNDGSIDQETTTNIFGEYVFENLATANYKIDEVPTNQQNLQWEQTFPTTNNGSHIVTFNSGDNLTLHFGNAPLISTLSGKKFHDINSNGLRDNDEPGLANWVIFLDANDDGILNHSVEGMDGTADGGSLEVFTKTDANGNYVFVVDPGVYHVREVQQEGWFQTTENPPNPDGVLNVQFSGQSYDSLNFGNSQNANPNTASIGDTIFNDGNGNGIQDIGELGIPNITVDLYKDNNNNQIIDGNDTLVSSTATNALGLYDFIGLAAGNYIVDVTDQNNDLDNFVNITGNNPLPLILTEGFDFNTADFGYQEALPLDELTVTFGDGLAKSITYQDDDGTIISLSAKGATGEVTFTGSNLNEDSGKKGTQITGENIFASLIKLNNTQSGNSLNIKTKGGDGFAEIGHLRVLGSMGKINGKSTILTDDVFIQKSLDSVTVGQIDKNVKIETSTASTKGTSFKVGDVASGVLIDLAGNIKSAQFNTFTSGAIFADEIAKLSIKNEAFGADVQARTGNVSSLSAANDITGQILANDSIGKISTKAGTFSGVARAGNNIGSLQAANLDQAIISAGKNIGKVNIAKDIIDSFILGGYDVGNDGALGLQAVDGVDNPGSGNIKSVGAKGIFSKSYISAGTLPVVPQTEDILLSLPPADGTIGSVKLSSIDLETTENYGLYASTDIKSVKIGKGNTFLPDNFIISILSQEIDLGDDDDDDIIIIF